MSGPVDERIVDMVFNNRQFESGIKESLNSLDNLKKGLEFNNDGALSGIASGVEAISSRFTAMGIAGMAAIMNITNRLVDMALQMAKTLTIAPITDGFQEYELKMGSIQTIMAGTGESLSNVNAKLDALNTYADRTIYFFGDMTSNIGKFTNAGVNLDKSVDSIQGIANVAALSGANTNEASRAMYNFAQALAAGHVKLIDWKSIENANMATKEFKQQLIDSAVAAGTLTDAGDGMYKTVKGKLISATKNFNDSLQDQWMTTEALVATLGRYSDETTDIGKRAFAAAQDVKTFTQLVDTVKEAVGSGWAKTFEILIGDFNEAKALFTNINNVVSSFVDNMSDARNELLSGGLSSGWKQLMEMGVGDAETFMNAIRDVGKEHSYAVWAMEDNAGSLEESFKKGWLSAEMLGEAITKNADKVRDLSDAELEAAGFTRQQADEMIALEASVKDGSLSLSEFAKKLSQASGREHLFEGLKNILQAISSVLKPIGDAFRETFSPTTAEGLYSMVESFKNFTATLKIGDETANKIKRTFAGLFAVLDLIGQGIKFVFNIGSELFGLFGGPAANGILDLTAKLGDFLVRLNATAKEGNLFSNAFDRLKNVFTVVADKIKDAIDRIKAAFSGFKDIDMGPLDEFAEKAKTRFKPFEALGKIFSGAFEVIVKVLEWAAPLLSKLGQVASAALMRLGDTITASVMNLEFNSILDLINTGLLGGLIVAIKKFVDSFKDIGEGLSGVKGLLEGVGGVLESYQNNIQAKTILTIAISIGILAASLVAISLIDSEKLTGALAGITVLFYELATAFKVVQASMKGNMLSRVGGELIAFSIAILILANAMKMIADLDWEGVAKGTLGIAALAAVLVIASEQLNKSNGKLIKGATGLIAFATAILIMTKAVEKLSGLSWEELGKGLVGLVAIITSITAAIKLMGSPKRMISTGLGMVAMGAAMLIFAEAVERMGNLPWDVIGRGLITMAGALTLVTVAVNFLPKGMVSKSVGMIGMAAALLIIANAVQTFGSMSWDEIGRGLTVMAGALGAIVVAMNLMPKGMITKALGLIGVAAALQIMIGPLSQMAAMSWEEIAKGIVMLGGSLGILVVALNLMTGALSGAAALLVASAALAIFAPVMKTLGGMPLAEIGKALLAIAGVFVLLGVGALALTPLIPAILALAGAIGLLGVAILAIGAGVLLFSAGMTALAVSGAAGTAALVAMVSGLISLIPMAMEQIGIGLMLLAGVIADSGPALIEALTTVILSLCSAIDTTGPVVIETVMSLLMDLLDAVVAYIPEITAAGMKIVIGFLNGIADNIGDVVTAGVRIVTEFLAGIGQNVQPVVDAGFQLIIDFINGISRSIDDNTEDLVTAIEGLINSMIGAAETVIKGMLDIGRNIVQGIIDGIGEKLNEAKEAAIRVASNIKDAITNFFKMASPSKLMRDEVGRYIVLGIAEGITKEMSAEEAATKKAQNIISAFKTELDKFKLDMSTFDLEFQLWEALNPNATEAQKAAMKQGLLGNKIMKQTENVELAQGEYLIMIENFGEASEEAQTAYNKFMQEQLNLANLINQSSDLQKESADKQKEARDNYYAYLRENAAYAKETGMSMEMLDLNARAATGYNPSILGKEMAEAAKESTSTAMAALESQFSAEAVNTFNTLTADFKAWGSTYGNAMGQGLTESTPEVVDASDTLMDGALKEAAENLDGWKELGASAAEGFANGMLENAPKVNAAAISLGVGAIVAGMGSIGANSPAKEFIKMGKFADQGLAVGLKSYSHLAEIEAANTGKSAVRVISDAISGISNIFGSDLDMSPTIRPVIDMDEIKKGSKSISDILGAPRSINIDKTRAVANAAAQSSKESSGVIGAKSVTNQYTFNQTNNSPKPLSRIDIYRQTKNQFSQLKGVTA